MELTVLLRPGHLFAVGGISISLFMAGIFWFRPWPGKKADRFLAAVFLCTAFSLTWFVATPGFLLETLPHLSRLSFPATILMAPMLLFYVRSLTEPGFRLRARDYAHFLPAVAFTAAFSPFYSQSGAYKAAFDASTPAPAYIHFLDRYAWYATLVFVLLYFITILGIISRHQRRIRETFSDVSRIKLAWITRMMVFSAACWCMIIALSLSDLFSGRLSYIDTNPVMVFVFLLFVGYKVLTQPSIYSEAGVFEPENAETRRDRPLEESRAREYESILKRSMEEKRLYTDPELTLPALADHLGIPRNVLSGLINRSTGDNFYNFVNSYRVEEVKRLMLRPDKKNLTLLAIAMEAGFNSKATFNAVFKAVTGITPTRFKAAAAAGAAPSG
jgi:AraC-like DNA-binding protein